MIISTTPVADAARSLGVDVETMMSIMSSLPTGMKIELCDNCGDILFVKKDSIRPFYCGWSYCKQVDYDDYWDDYDDYWDDDADGWTSDYDRDYYAMADPYEGIDCGFRGKLPQWVPVP